MLNCKQASELMSQSMDSKLPFSQKMALKFHLIICHGCSNFLKQIYFLRKAARQLVANGHYDSIYLSDESKKRIQEALKSQDKGI